MNYILTILIKVKLYIEVFRGIVISRINKNTNPYFKCTKETIRCCDNKKSPNFKYHRIGENIPLCCATHLVGILNDVSKTLEKHKAEYFISFGTLLGSVRHGGIIPWDTDVDIIIAKKDEKSIFSILVEELKDKYYIKIDIDGSLLGGSLIRVFLSEQNKLHVDLFSYVEYDTNISFYTNKTFKKDDIFPLKKIDFYSLKLFAPKNIKNHLCTLYGEDYMIYAYKQWAANKKKFKIKSFEAAKIDNIIK